MFALGGALRASGQAALLMEEPFGKFGRFNPTGHAAIYLARVCATTPAMLRACEPGELGVVISRYHRVDGYDWIAMPLVPYLYAVDDVKDIPKTANRSLEAELRDTYRRQYLQDLVPDGPNGETPKGEWIQLVGASYDRKIYGFEIPTTVEQDQSLIEDFNTQRNNVRFNLLFHNCADFSRTVINTYYYQHAMRRNWIADVGITTPKELVRSLERTSRKRGIPLQVFMIPQVPGSIPRSIRVDGVLEAFLKRKYVLPVAVLHPVVAGSIALVYLMDGRFNLPKNPAVLDVTALSEAAQGLAELQRSSPTESVALESAVTLAVTHAFVADPDAAVPAPDVPSTERQKNTEQQAAASPGTEEK
jgi:RES domain-containing protein